jgi:hypothetical protein
MNLRIWLAALSSYCSVIGGKSGYVTGQQTDRVFGFFASGLPQQVKPKSPLDMLTKVTYELKQIFVYT